MPSSQFCSAWASVHLLPLALRNAGYQFSPERLLQLPSSCFQSSCTLIFPSYLPSHLPLRPCLKLFIGLLFDSRNKSKLSLSLQLHLPGPSWSSSSLQGGADPVPLLWETRPELSSIPLLGLWSFYPGLYYTSLGKTFSQNITGKWFEKANSAKRL